MSDNYFENCSFCGWSYDRVDYLVVGPQVSICIHCAKTIVEMYKMEMERERAEETARQEFFSFYGSDI